MSYNKNLKNKHNGASNKPARMVVGALIIKHMENFSDVKTIEAIQENPYMQYLVGLTLFTTKPIFTSPLFVSIRKRLNEDFFNELTLMLHEATKGKKKDDSNGGSGDNNKTHIRTLKIDATCCNAEVRYPTDISLLEDGSKVVNRLINKCVKQTTYSQTAYTQK